ncbi:MAG: small acid-soluble spore protein SspI [Erysipelotrichaceae bacterium]|nr:small acid-soluble spore protein SspI [Erysipelotrichaceae bacterium]
MREFLKNNLKGFTSSKLKQTIDEGIASKDEAILVGLGVLFEEYYQSIDDNTKQHFLEYLSSLL